MLQTTNFETESSALSSASTACSFLWHRALKVHSRPLRLPLSGTELLPRATRILGISRIRAWRGDAPSREGGSLAPAHPTRSHPPSWPAHSAAANRRQAQSSTADGRDSVHIGNTLRSSAASGKLARLQKFEPRLTWKALRDLTGHSRARAVLAPPRQRTHEDPATPALLTPPRPPGEDRIIQAFGGRSRERARNHHLSPTIRELGGADG